MKKEETKEAREAREAEKKKRERQIFWKHLKFRTLAAIIGLILFILVPFFVGALGWGVVLLTKWVWTGGTG